METQVKAEVTETQELTVGGTVMAVFRNTLPNSRMHFKNGKEIIFLNGEFLTNNKAEIDELMEEIQAGNPHLYIDPKRAVVDTKFVDPVAAIREKLLKELREQGKLIEGGAADYGTSDQNLKLNAGNTRDVASAMSGSTSTDAGAGTAKIVAGPR